MSDKPIWRGFGNLLGGGKQSKPLTTVEQRCAAGLHHVDPRWSKCPYCEAAKNAGEQSSRVLPETAQAEPFNAAPRSPLRTTLIDDGQPAPPVGPGPTVMSAAASGGGSGRRGRTIVDPEPVATGGAVRPAGSGRRLVGIVTTYTWSQLGQLYEVRNGRNYAGSDVVSSDNNAPCDILVPEDSTMSSAHFLILCQGGKVIITDNLSTNGTYVNGVQIDTRGMDLPDNAVIKAGATVFTFQKIRVAQGTQEPTRESDRWRHGEEDPVD